MDNAPADASPQQRAAQVEAAVQLALASLLAKQAENEAAKARIAAELGREGGISEARAAELQGTLALITEWEHSVPRAQSVLAQWLQQSRAAAAAAGRGAVSGAAAAIVAGTRLQAAVERVA